jgi:hypothetical protein
MDIIYIVAIVWAHFVADFVLQTDTMARNKSTSNIWLSNHIVVYMAAMLALLAPFIYFIDPTVSRMQEVWLLGWLIVWVAVNGALHWITDWCSSRATSYLWKKGDRHKFFVVIGADQAVHLTTMFVTWAWIFS